MLATLPRNFLSFGVVLYSVVHCCRGREFIEGVENDSSGWKANYWYVEGFYMQEAQFERMIVQVNLTIVYQNVLHNLSQREMRRFGFFSLVIPWEKMRFASKPIE